MIDETSIPLFHFTGSNGQILGRLWQDGNRLEFDGNVSACAQLFFDEMIKLNSHQLLRLEAQNTEMHQELLRLEHELEYWKNNHATEVECARVLKSRKDMPADRVLLYKATSSAGVAYALDQNSIMYDVTKSERLALLLDVYQASKKLVECKGRFHAEQNYRALAKVMAVALPDLAPLEGDE